MYVPRRQPLRTRGRGTVLSALPSWRGVTKSAASRSPVETDATEGDSPVDEIALTSLTSVPEYHGTRETPWESGGTTLQG